MNYYKIENDKIVDVLNYNSEEFVPQEIKDNYLVTDKEIVNTTNGLMFADNVNQQAEEQAIKQQEIMVTKQGLINAVQTYMDTTAQTRGYDSIASACSYGLSTVQKFREEAVACISWRDNVWNYCYEQLALFESGQRDVPTVEQLIAELPTLDW